MSENKRTPEQILEEANAFFEKAGVTAALEEFLNSERVKTTVEKNAKLCEEEIRAMVSEQKDELIAKAEEAGLFNHEAECFMWDFLSNFRIFMFLEHIGILKAYGVEEEAIFTMLSNVFANNSEILHRLVNEVCSIQWDRRCNDAYKLLEKLDSGEEEVPEPQPMTVENCGETKCLYDENCREVGFCLKGKEFHCNGKGKDSGKCNCPGFLSCVPGLYYPCEELNFTVIPPEGGCGECGVN